MLQLCAAGRSQTLLVLCCLLIGPRLTTRGRTASGVSMWKRTSGSCLTSKCKRLHPGVRLEITQGGQRGCQAPDINTHTPLGYFPILCLIYADTLQNANRKVFLWLQSLIRFFFNIPYIKNSVLLPARSLTRLASKPSCSHFPGVCLRVGFEMNLLWQSTTLSHLFSLPNCNSAQMHKDVKTDRCAHKIQAHCFTFTNHSCTNVP